MTARTAVVCDDHPLVRDALRSLLSKTHFDVLADVGTGQEALEIVRRTTPRLLVLDLVLPDGLGTALLPELRRISPRTAVVLLTSFSDDRHMGTALRAGADGLLLKTMDPGRLAASLEAVVLGETVIERSIAKRFALRGPPADDGHGMIPPLDTLSPRERDVLRWVAQGERNSEIAARLGLKEKTVKSHVSAILFKLDVADRTQAAVIAWRAGLGE